MSLMFTVIYQFTSARLNFVTPLRRWPPDPLYYIKPSEVRIFTCSAEDAFAVLDHIVKIWKESALEADEEPALEASGGTVAVLKSLIL